VRDIMRFTIIAILLGVSPAALADRTGGSSGGGRLSQVSSGLATASAGALSSSRNAAPTGSFTTECADYRNAREHDVDYRNTIREHDCAPAVIVRPGLGVSAGTTNETGASVDAFAGLQKVYQSDGSATVALSIVDPRFRLNGSLTHYSETEPMGTHVSMMVPELTIGVRLGTIGTTHAWLEGGVMMVKTNDPRGDTSVSGVVLGARIEQRVSSTLSMIATAEHASLADNVTAWAGRVGVRFHHVEAAFRVLDLSVGPALYGPELGVGF
jgi:hypothetical protein